MDGTSHVKPRRFNGLACVFRGTLRSQPACCSHDVRLTAPPADPFPFPFRVAEAACPACCRLSVCFSISPVPSVALPWSCTAMERSHNLSLSTHLLFIYYFFSTLLETVCVCESVWMLHVVGTLRYGFSLPFISKRRTRNTQRWEMPCSNPELRVS